MSPGENGIHSILSASNADHARYRRLLSHAFSESALREQEYLPLVYIDLLIRRLREVVAASGDKGAVVDIVKWLNFTTFDIVGDLALGESFSCLEKSEYHGWVSILFSQFKFAGIFISLRFFGLDKPLRMVLPKSLLRRRAEHAQYSKDRIYRRLDQGKHGPDAQRNDFMAYVLRHNDEKGMTVPEIEQTFRVLVVAGSETTGTALSGILDNLLQSPDIMEKLAKEIRQSFQDASDICANQVSKLPYLNAVIEEGLRLCPPVPLGLPRVVPAGGATVSGQWLPGGVGQAIHYSPTMLKTNAVSQTFVSCSGYASNRSSLNFPSSPSVFDPSRWLQPSNSSKADPSAFNPFSLGPRNCLGRNLAYLEMRLILAYLLWHFDFETEGKAWRWEDQKTWILWEKKPLNVRIRERAV